MVLGNSIRGRGLFFWKCLVKTTIFQEPFWGPIKFPRSFIFFKTCSSMHMYLWLALMTTMR